MIKLKKVYAGEAGCYDVNAQIELSPAEEKRLVKADAAEWVEPPKLHVKQTATSKQAEDAENALNEAKAAEEKAAAEKAEADRIAAEQAAADQAAADAANAPK